MHKRFVCACDGCITLLDEDVSYFHGSMEDLDLESISPATNKCPVLESYEVHLEINTKVMRSYIPLQISVLRHLNSLRLIHTSTNTTRVRKQNGSRGSS